MAQRMFEPFHRGYVAAALWAETDEDGSPLDANYSYADFSPGSREALLKDCLYFVKKYEKYLVAYCALTGCDMEAAGRDFWLTRNGHGAGFWDRGAGDVGEFLTEAAHALGSREIYTGPGGFLFIENGGLCHE